jgi:signal transduction histidine kinase
VGVEHAQQEAAARAELGSNLRVALWRLDGRMLPSLGVEDSRPFYHYGPADPDCGYGVATTPLLVTNLPDWMKLHFQLDVANGWESPQVLAADVVDRVRQTYPETPLRNVNPEREAVLAEVRKKFPFHETLDVFATHDRAIPADAFSPPAPLIVGSGATQPEPLPNSSQQPIAPPASTTPASNSVQTSVQSSATPIPMRDTIRIFGLEVCLHPVLAPATANNLATNQRLDPESMSQSAPAPRQGLSPQGVVPGLSRMQTSKDLENTQGTADNITRAGTVYRGMNDVKPTPGTAQPNKGQGNYSQFNNSNYMQNNALGQNDQKLLGNQMLSPAVPTVVGNTTNIPTVGTNPTTPVTSPSSPTAAGGPSQVIPAPVPTGTGTGGGGFGGGSPGGFGGPGGRPFTPAAPSSPGANPSLAKSSTEDKDNGLAKFKQTDADGKGLGALVGVAEKAAKSEMEKTGMRAAEKAMKDAARKGRSEQNFFCRLFDRSHVELLIPPATDDMRMGFPSPLDAATVAGIPVPFVPLPPSVYPMPSDTVASTNPPPWTIVPPAAIHLGSMRPQWVIGPDGSEMLVLVRVAKVDNKTVCQGIILDWMKLEAMLQDEVKDLFPNAKLLPINDPAGVSPDRAMTALPIQLDPGPQPEPPPAGWTTLRLGLLLAWAAAVIAFAAVGFCGWTLIDLAERRIRFVSAVTHELRTPLTSLRLYLDMLVSGMIQDEAKKQEYLNTLATESDRLHRLIDNVLDFARLEKRRKGSDIKPVRVSELIEQLRQTWTDRLAQDGKELVVISTLVEGREVKTDAAMLHQIIGNLIDNARKYARDAADRRIWVWAKPGAGNSVMIEVEDRGPGVPANERRSIFKPFRRGEQADSTSGGAGLGLALAKSWAEVLGGKLSYRPADGGTGACFRLELPMS